MSITAEMIKDLRKATGAGVLEAKKALEAVNGDYNKAVDALREKGLARADKKSDRSAKDGMIKMYAHPGNRVGVMLELNCETDFVARNEAFQTLAHELSLHIAAMSPRYITREEVPAGELQREMDVLRAQALSEGKPEAIVDKIVSGRVNKFYEEMCLMEQPFVKDDKRKIEDMIKEAISVLGENIIVRRFARYELGEGLE
ncbi:MAG: translation elongation factor Ts [Chloroflexi bacterium]|jgi:elongation factor Ts|nr:translation elongation factor Ts [Chloroflexota bacterium]